MHERARRRRNAGRQHALHELARGRPAPGSEPRRSTGGPHRLPARRAESASPGGARSLTVARFRTECVKSESSRAGGRGEARPPCPDSRIASTWSPASSWVSRAGDLGLAVADDRDQPCALRQPAAPRMRLPSHAAPRSIVTSTISRFSLRSSSSWISPCSGHLVLDQRHDRSRSPRSVGEIPSKSKYGWLRGSLMRAITFATP